MEYHLQYMPPEELERVYPKMEQDFPPNELKRQPHLRALMESGMSVGWYLMADGKAAGYAFMLRHPAAPYVLLDYLAMEERGHGAGSACLALLKNEYPQGIIAEVEAVDPGLDAETAALRRRRIGFYQRAGFIPCPFPNRIFDVHYLVHLWHPAARSIPPRASPPRWTPSTPFNTLTRSTGTTCSSTCRRRADIPPVLHRSAGMGSVRLPGSENRDTIKGNFKQFLR